MRFVLSASNFPPSVLDVSVSDGEPLALTVGFADFPDAPQVGIELHADGSISVGHWPDGEQWSQVLRTVPIGGEAAAPRKERSER